MSNLYCLSVAYLIFLLSPWKAFKAVAVEISEPKTKIFITKNLTSFDRISDRYNQKCMDGAKQYEDYIIFQIRQQEQEYRSILSVPIAVKRILNQRDRFPSEKLMLLQEFTKDPKALDRWTIHKLREARRLKEEASKNCLISKFRY